MMQRSFPADASSAAGGRRWVVEQLLLVGECADDVAVLVSELITNSVLHAGLAPGEMIVVRASRRRGQVRVEVRDEGGRFDKPSAGPLRTEGGRGLKLVEALAADWGVHHNGVTLVWFTYSVPRDRGGPAPAVP